MQGQLVAVPDHGDGYRGARLLGADRRPELIPGVHARAPERDDLVTGTEARLDRGGRGIGLGAAGGGDAGGHAGVDGPDRGGVGVGQADARGQDEQQHEGQREVHERPGGQHDHPLPAGLPAEGARLVLGVHVLQGGHADDLDETARGDDLDAVLGLAPDPGPQCLAETHEELGDFHPELLRRGEVPRLVQHDREEQGEDEDDPAEQGHPADSPSPRVPLWASRTPPRPPAVSSSARIRAQ